jgi:hypothetical protein
MNTPQRTGDGLLGKTVMMPDVPDAWVADSMQVMGMSCIFDIDDVLVRGPDVGLVKACCMHRRRLCAFVEPLVLVEQISEHTVIVRSTAALVVWHAEEICQVLAWRRSAADNLWHVIRE